MQLKITIEWVDDDDTTQQREVALIERDQLNAATCGLSMVEAKSILANMQQTLVTVQAEEYVRQHYRCEHCGDRLRGNGQHSIVLRTLFGRLRLPSPRFRSCRCQAFSSDKKTLSPLAAILPERTTPELSYLECKWSALLSYGMTTRLLGDLLQLDKQISTAVLSRQVSTVAERSEAKIGNEERVFMDASGWHIARLPNPPAPLTVGIDGE